MMTSLVRPVPTASAQSYAASLYAVANQARLEQLTRRADVLLAAVAMAPTPSAPLEAWSRRLACAPPEALQRLIAMSWRECFERYTGTSSRIRLALTTLLLHQPPTLCVTPDAFTLAFPLCGSAQATLATRLAPWQRATRFTPAILSWTVHATPTRTAHITLATPRTPDDLLRLAHLARTLEPVLRHA